MSKNPSAEEVHKGIFRKEAYTKFETKYSGSVSLGTPIPSHIVIGLLIIILSLIFYALFNFEITKRITISGVISPVSGVISVTSISSGVITKQYVEEGTAVIEGQTLFEISTDRRNEHDGLAEAIQKQIDNKMSALNFEKESYIKKSKLRGDSLTQRLNNLTLEREALQSQIVLAKRRSIYSEKSVADYGKLADAGFMPAMQTQKKQEELLDSKERFAGLAREVVKLDATEIEIRSDLATAKIELIGELSQVDRNIANLTQERIENQLRSVTYITAPKASTLTAINYQVGQNVSTGQILATLIPTNVKKNNSNEVNSMEVLLYAPSRSAGFVAPAQKVRLKIDAFPYQKFGTQEGEVLDVSTTPFAPGEIPANVVSSIQSTSQNANSQGGLSLYRIKIRLLAQEMLIYGKKRRFTPGMTVEADIVQSRRKIWEWVLEPLLTRSSK